MADEIDPTEPIRIREGELIIAYGADQIATLTSGSERVTARLKASPGITLTREFEIQGKPYAQFSAHLDDIPMVITTHGPKG